MNVALSARISTHDRQTLPLQLAQLHEYAARRNWQDVYEIQEIGSGSKTDYREKNF